MKSKINELNNLYSSVLDNIEQVRRCMGSHHIDHALVFLNTHHIKLDNEIVRIQYPIPTILCKLNGIQTKIGLDLATNETYIGFIKFTLTKEDLLSFNFEALRSFRIGIYGFYYYQELVNFDDLEQIKLNASRSGESVLHIKTRISSIKQIENIIDKMTEKKETSSQKRFSMISYVCDCQQQITIDTYSGQCPICGKDSPHKRKVEATCSICGRHCLKDQYGNGECENCGWQFERDEESLEKARGISYPMLVTPTTAREQFKKGLPFKATFNEFINGLYFYSEMQFEHDNIMYEVYFEHDEKIIFCSSEMIQEYSSREDFQNNAHINKRLLKDIWHEVKNPNFMQCG
ncbi:MAG: hypothetical protein J6A28_00105 [Clostridia bacterium]|nr:hypothetical protein [Clostridia bacterium]